MFVLPAQALHLHLNCSMVVRGLTVNNFYSCETIIQSTGALCVENVTARHLPGKSNNDVIGISFQRQFMRRIPCGIQTSFQNLQVVTVFETQLMSIAREDIRQFPSLRDLDLTSNRIQSIPRDLFKDNRLVRSVALNLNPLKHVAHQTFDNLPELRILSLLRSNCIDRNSNTREETLLVMRNMFLECPPSIEMIQENVLREIKESIMVLRDCDCQNIN